MLTERNFGLILTVSGMVELGPSVHHDFNKNTVNMHFKSWD